MLTSHSLSRRIVALTPIDLDSREGRGGPNHTAVKLTDSGAVLKYNGQKRRRLTFAYPLVLMDRPHAAGCSSLRAHRSLPRQRPIYIAKARLTKPSIRCHSTVLTLASRCEAKEWTPGVGGHLMLRRSEGTISWWYSGCRLGYASTMELLGVVVRFAARSAGGVEAGFPGLPVQPVCMVP